jgi:hypothetical protein
MPKRIKNTLKLGALMGKNLFKQSHENSAQFITGRILI